MVIDHIEGDGRMSFRIYLPHAGQVDLVGDFTEWDRHPVPMRRGEIGTDNEGWWLAECSVPDGDHAFSYLVDRHYWMPDYAASGVHRNAYGQWTSNLTVLRSRRTAETRDTAPLVST